MEEDNNNFPVVFRLHDSMRTSDHTLYSLLLLPYRERQFIHGGKRTKIFILNSSLGCSIVARWQSYERQNNIEICITISIGKISCSTLAHFERCVMTSKNILSLISMDIINFSET